MAKKSVRYQIILKKRKTAEDKTETSGGDAKLLGGIYEKR